MNIESMKQSLYCGVWGTIGPKFTEASSLFNQKCATNHGILMHSKTAAYETALRSLGIGYGDLVLCAAYSDKMDAEIAAAIGATPIFADIESHTLTLSAGNVEALLGTSSKIKAVTLDYSEALDLPSMKLICKKYSCALIINAGDALDAVLELDGIYAVIYDLGICGAAVTSQEETYASLFAFHHCGHAPGTTEAFCFDEIIGGDMRVSEWQAIEAMEIFKEPHPVKPVSANGYILSYDNPVFKTEYFRKMTGFNGEYSADCYPNARTAIVND